MRWPLYISMRINLNERRLSVRTKTKVSLLMRKIKMMKKQRKKWKRSFAKVSNFYLISRLNVSFFRFARCNLKHKFKKASSVWTTESSLECKRSSFRTWTFPDDFRVFRFINLNEKWIAIKINTKGLLWGQEGCGWIRYRFR